MNYSKQREAVHQALKDNVVHPTAEYLHGILLKENSNIGLATVYRNLNQLSSFGLIKKIEGLEDSVHFDHNTHEHYHFICNKCGKVHDVPAEIAPNIVEDAQKATGFKIEGHKVVFDGLCKDCY